MILGANHFPMVTLAIALYGVAYGTNSILIRSIVGSEEQSSIRAEWFVHLSVLTNIASLFGPLIALYSYSNISPKMPFFMAFVAMILFAIYTFSARRSFILPHAQKSWTAALIAQKKDIRIYHFFALTVLSWGIYSQLFTSLTIKINQLSSPQQVGNFLSFNAGLCIIFAPLLQKIINQKSVSPFSVICASLLFHSIGFMLMHFSENLIELYGSMAVWTLGEFLLIPTLQSSLSGMVDKGILVSVLAINSIAMGMGEGIGGFVGIFLIKNTDLCFLIFSAISLMTLAYVVVSRHLLRPSST